MLLRQDDSLFHTDVYRCRAPGCDFGATCALAAFLAHLRDDHDDVTAAATVSAHDAAFGAPALAAREAFACALCGERCAGEARARRHVGERHGVSAREYR